MKHDEHMFCILQGGYECIRYVVPKESDVDGVDFIMLSTEIKTD